MKLKKIAALLAVAGLSAPAFATNGMNMEAYGPIAGGMGGASMAYYTGAAGMMNNPATMSMCLNGCITAAVGFLGPDVSASAPGAPTANSGGDAYVMPAMGYTGKAGKLTYGVGVFAQGGMGTEYAANSFLALGTGKDVRSELGVGRLIFPLAYQVNDDFAIGGSVDWVWATMDIKMAATTGQFAAMGTNMSAGFAAMMPGLMGTNDNFRIDFSDNHDFGGAAFGSGWAGKLGFTYKLSPQMTVGGSYHSKTSLGDMKTDNSAASFAAYNVGTNVIDPASGGAPIPGKITIHNFQWPETYGLGLAYQPNDQWLIAADYKRINWSDVMKDFKMTFSTSAMGGQFADFKINQNWKNQNVYMMGAAYKVSEAFTLRFGFNYAKNPIPDDRVHPLFPAIVEKHYTAGFGYMFDKKSAVDFSLTYAPEVSVTGTQMAPGALGSGVGNNGMINIKHSQLNWQAQYRHAF